MTELPWLPFIYQYSIGGIVFAWGILLAVRKKVLVPSVRQDRVTIVQLVSGFFFFFAIHAILILISGA